MGQLDSGQVSDRFWLYVLCAGISAVLLLTIIFLSFYHHHPPDIPNDQAAWGNFGSPLSAFITLVGSVIVIVKLTYNSILLYRKPAL